MYVYLKYVPSHSTENRLYVYVYESIEHTFEVSF